MLEQEHWRTHEVELEMSSGWFNHPNLLELAWGIWTTPVVKLDMSSVWFKPTKPPRTSLSNRKGEGTRHVGELEMSSGLFNPTEPPRTCSNNSTCNGTRHVVELDMSWHVRLHRSPGSICCAMVWRGLEESNHLKLVSIYPMILLHSEAQWFE